MGKKGGSKGVGRKGGGGRRKKHKMDLEDLWHQSKAIKDAHKDRKTQISKDKKTKKQKASRDESPSSHDHEAAQPSRMHEAEKGDDERWLEAPPGPSGAFASLMASLHLPTDAGRKAKKRERTIEAEPGGGLDDSPTYDVVMAEEGEGQEDEGDEGPSADITSSEREAEEQADLLQEAPLPDDDEAVDDDDDEQEDGPSPASVLDFSSSFDAELSPSDLSQASAVGDKPTRLHPPHFGPFLYPRPPPSHLTKLMQTPPHPSLSSSVHGIPQPILESFHQLSTPAGGADDTLSEQDAGFFHFMNGYVDVLHANHDHTTSRSIRQLYCLHVTNHLFKCRQGILRNNAALSRAVKGGGEAVDPAGEDRFRDQGFTRPRVLILVPFKSVAKEVVETILKLYPHKKQVMHRHRFEEDFSAEDGDEEGKFWQDRHKPPDYIDIFKGNQSDRFRLGIMFLKTGVRLYAPFYSADMIVASPLGLRLITGAQGEKDTSREYDFLSSIELVVIDRADVLKQQSWEHVEHVMQAVNLKPKALHDLDIRRLRPSYAAGRAANYRQMIVTSDGMNVESTALLASSCNYRGHVKLLVPSTGQPLARAAATGVRQLFQQVPCSDVNEAPERMLHWLEKKAYPTVISTLSQLILVVPSYVEFVSVRQVLRSLDAEFCACHEYSSKRAISRARAFFAQGRIKLMVVSERWLFYRRYRLAGAAHLLFLGPPERPAIYCELIDGLSNHSQALVLTYFTAADSMSLERLCGPVKARKMIKGPPQKVFAFT
ncbi:unnamed protein product [Vitrella brassicaformis CCMP3155]|uniref:U3 small nucleolar RNA-associated protein 25 n=1 Tax=Vitrella brassicaformis (strain CCMP3155) TaxID=1169540 RepID=A0A0G4H1B4_VITBC|nr:unnamed protein product [Vitrella brassicaformis CCMP3155]|eukprot:CEM37384.1 unnamed protein product [Vitrella brassicaformis CCMP3155]